jgi:hypothetical protein
LAYQPPANSTFLSEPTSHQQPANSTFLSEQISTSYQPPANRTGSNVTCTGKELFLLGGKKKERDAAMRGQEKNVIIFFTFTSVETLGQEGKECARWCDSNG